jgi:hypothetical protein
MCRAIEGLHEALDGNLGLIEASQIEEQLAIVRNSDRKEIVSLANAIGEYLQDVKEHFPVDKPGIWQRLNISVDKLGHIVGRRWHHMIISGILILWVALVIGYIFVLAKGGTNLDSQVVQWRSPLLYIQVLVGVVMIITTLF